MPQCIICNRSYNLDVEDDWAPGQLNGDGYFVCYSCKGRDGRLAVPTSRYESIPSNNRLLGQEEYQLRVSHYKQLGDQGVEDQVVATAASNASEPVHTTQATEGTGGTEESLSPRRMILSKTRSRSAAASSVQHPNPMRKLAPSKRTKADLQSPSPPQSKKKTKVDRSKKKKAPATPKTVDGTVTTPVQGKM